MANYDILLALFMLQIYAVLQVQAFWWPSSTTESPNVMFKQVPLTYFRTYTYQPLVGNPLSYPFLGNNFFGEPPLDSSSILNGMRYDRVDSNFAHLKNSYANPMMPFMANKYAAMSPILATRKSTTTVRPVTKTTSTTTSTTPQPTTTRTTTTMATSTIPNTNYMPELPLYNRRPYYNNYQRQPYPYPNYNAFDNNNNLNYIDRPSSTSYMPCMCPVGISPNGQSSFASTQSRSSDSADNNMAIGSDLEVPIESKPASFLTNEDTTVTEKSLAELPAISN